nr:MAG TPA: hypothetical protein [Caudoviricetes sp.]
MSSVTGESRSEQWRNGVRFPICYKIGQKKILKGSA